MFKKGEISNPEGRKVGQKNNKTKQVHDVVFAMLSKTAATFDDDLVKLDPKDRIQLTMALIAYILPKPREEARQEDKDRIIKIMGVSDNELDDLLADKVSNDFQDVKLDDSN
jgi:hypothetical protein